MSNIVIGSRKVTITISNTHCTIKEMRRKWRICRVTIYGGPLSATHMDPDSKVHGANMGPIWGRLNPGGPHVGPMNFAIWGCLIVKPKVLILRDQTLYWPCRSAISTRIDSNGVDNAVKFKTTGTIEKFHWSAHCHFPYNMHAALLNFYLFGLQMYIIVSTLAIVNCKIVLTSMH